MSGEPFPDEGREDGMTRTGMTICALLALALPFAASAQQSRSQLNYGVLL